MNMYDALDKWATIFLVGLSIIEIFCSCVLHVLIYFGAVSLDIVFRLVVAGTAITWILAFYSHLRAIYKYNGWKWPNYGEQMFSGRFWLVSIQVWTKREYAKIGMPNIPKTLQRLVLPFLLACFLYAVLAVLVSPESGTTPFLEMHSLSLLLVSMSLYNFSIHYSRLKSLDALK